MSLPFFLVDPDGKLSWEHDWTQFLGEGETIESRIWTISPLNPGSPETPILTNATSNVVFVEGLWAGRVYKLQERITTNNGVIDEKTIILRAGQT